MKMLYQIIKHKETKFNLKQAFVIQAAAAHICHPEMP